jgi:hypothetical protein
MQLPLTSSKHPSNHPGDHPSSSPYQLTGSFPRTKSHIPEPPTLWQSNIVIQNGHLKLIFLFKILIFYSKLLVYQRVRIPFNDKHPSDF